MDKKIMIDTVAAYCQIHGLPVAHPLVTVVDTSQVQKHAPAGNYTFSYGVYALFLKDAKCGDLIYGRQPYDYQEGTVVSFAPGQVVSFHYEPQSAPRACGLLFHPDLIHGTSLGRNIRQYHFFSYSSREALHLNDEERDLFRSLLGQVSDELRRPADSHTLRLVSRHIELLLDYCLRFYERQFTTRTRANKDILEKLEDVLDAYFSQGLAVRDGLPSVKYLAEQCFLSPNYFGDLVKRETGRTPQEYIQRKIVDLAKHALLDRSRTVKEIAYGLGFSYPQHFNRYFKRNVGVSPTEYRRRAV